MLYVREIRSYCFYPSAYGRGQEIFNDKRYPIDYCVREEVPGDFREIRAQIQGSGWNVYEASLTLDISNPSDEAIEDYECTCPAYENFEGMCKHCVALALAYRDSQSKSVKKTAGSPANRPTSPGLAQILARYSAVGANVSNGVHRGQVVLKPELDYSSFYGDSRWSLSCQIGTARMYVVKNLANLTHNVLAGKFFQYGKQLGFVHAPEMFDQSSQGLLSVIEGEIRKRCRNIEANAYDGTTAYRTLHLDPESVRQLMELYMGKTISVNSTEYPVAAGNPDIELLVKPSGSSGASVSVPLMEEPVPGYLLVQGTIYRVSPDFAENVLPFLRVMRGISRTQESPAQYLSESDYRSFCGNLLPLLSPYLTVRTEELDFSDYLPQTPEFSFYLSMNEEQALVMKPQVSYGAATYPLYEIKEGQYRRAELEQPVLELLNAYFTPMAQPDMVVCAREDAMFDFLQDGFDALGKFGEIFVENSARKAYVSPTPSARVSVSLTGGLIDLTAEVENMPQEEMNRLLNAYSQKKKYYRLSSGEFLSLEEGSLSVLSEVSQALQLQGKGLSHVQIPAFRAQYLNAMLTGQGNDIQVERTSDFKSLVRRVRDYQDSDYRVPSQLHASLRSYQKIGFRWMCALADCGLGGILADDMGLGKTVQTIAYLLHRGKNALIVCPASLVYNWAAELRRFAPTLSVELILGPADVRKTLLKKEADVLVTSYDLLRRDIAFYEDKCFDSCILDEAQYVRNTGTKLAKSVKQIHAQVRFALTGTPIFNRLGDLWSIFDFLLPGYLYTYPKFREQIEMPVAKGEQEMFARLQKLTAPFILRRRKSEVLKELPEKTESVQLVEMTREQRQLYLAQEQQLRQSLQEADDTQFRQNRIAYLAALTRLRQLCCTPELYLEGYRGGSGKVDACMELLEEAVSGEHKVLVFSQFTTMLDALFARAQEKGFSCQMLTGKNTKEQRKQMVEEFQRGEYDVFFISLKAGGTGLNLTAADWIIHFDPWWNAAAEDQATDRAHRIGQTNKVFVTKLVAKDSVEERIVELQEKKRSLSDGIMETQDTRDASLGKETLLTLLAGAETF